VAKVVNPIRDYLITGRPSATLGYLFRYIQQNLTLAKCEKEYLEII
jgi:hypothetical protein